MQTVQLIESMVIANIANCRKIIMAALQNSLQDSPDTDHQTADTTNNSEIVFDLGQISDCDSAGVQLLIATHKQSIEKEMKVHFVNYSDAVVSAFKIVGIENIGAYFSS